MIKLLLLVISAFVFGIFLMQGGRSPSNAQTVSPSPSPTTTVPSGAPSTGFGK